MSKVEELKMHYEEVSLKVNAVKDQENSGKNEMIQKDLEKMMKTIKNRVSLERLKFLGGEVEVGAPHYQIEELEEARVILCEQERLAEDGKGDPELLRAEAQHERAVSPRCQSRHLRGCGQEERAFLFEKARLGGELHAEQELPPDVQRETDGEAG